VVSSSEVLTLTTKVFDIRLWKVHSSGPLGAIRYRPWLSVRSDVVLHHDLISYRYRVIDDLDSM